MATTKNTDKVVISVVAVVVTAVAWSLIMAGSVVPRWARPLNASHHAEANQSYSLWGREDCYGVICTTTFRTEFSKINKWYYQDGQKVEKTIFKEEQVPIVKCVEANYCNITWFGDDDSGDTPSLLLVSRAFVIPALVCGLLTFLLYVLKLVLLLVRPLWKRIYVKAAYLTFSAIAGVTCTIAVVVFATMLEKDVYELLWAPALCGAGGGLFLLIGVGGYLSWRNKSAFEDWDDRSEVSVPTLNVYEFSSSGKYKDDKCHGKGYMRSVSYQSNKSDLL